MYIKEAKIYLDNYPEITKEFRGCTEEQIIDLEFRLNTKLPEAYKEFLRWFGQKSGQIMRGSDFNFRCVSGEAYQNHIEKAIRTEEVIMKKEAIELLNEHNFDGEQLLQNTLVFLSHQGTAYQYMKLDNTENPKVYMFAEQGDWLEKGPLILAESFSEYLLNMLKQNIDALKHLGYIK